MLCFNTTKTHMRIVDEQSVKRKEEKNSVKTIIVNPTNLSCVFILVNPSSVRVCGADDD